MNIATAVKPSPVTIDRADLAAPILFAPSRTEIGIRAGTVIQIEGRTHAFGADTPVAFDELTPGRDYGVTVDGEGKPFAAAVPSNPLGDRWFAGFHFAPGGCAQARAGGDTIPAINPFSLWDVDFRFAGPDPRGMTMVEVAGGRRAWVDIYLPGVDHHEHGTSRCGATIADGRDLPMRPDGKTRFKRFDYAAAVDLLAYHGKRLLTIEEFFAAAIGVQERCSRDGDPVVTGVLKDGAERFISQRGVFDVTGSVWQWATDGDPDEPRPSILGGTWLYGVNAGSRFAALGGWPGDSDESLSARGGGDHLNPA